VVARKESRMSADECKRRDLSGTVVTPTQQKTDNLSADCHSRRELGGSSTVYHQNDEREE
jgi:hypothetical protein